MKLKYYLLEDVIDIQSLFRNSFFNLNTIDDLLNINFNFPINNKGGCYKIIFPDDSWYIGKSNNIVKRIWGHLCEQKSNNEMYKILKEIDKSELIVLKISNKESDEMKMLKIHLKNDKNHCYNIRGNTRLTKTK
jgi:predicted GIY-YIG superfamily endonuclease